MGAKTEIAWTDSTWNPIRGCSRISAGCKNCYAERMAARFSEPGMPYHGLAVMQPTGPKWTGKVRLVEEHLEDPLRWKRPRRIFVNSMSDLFHESLNRCDIAKVFRVMGEARQHTFQVLTKRARGMREWFETATGRIHGGIDIPEYPFPNVWLGVSVENQEAADERIPELLRTPAAVRFLSVEPQIGPVDLRRAFRGYGYTPSSLRGVDWVIVGGESGPGARPFDLEWARSIVRQCKDAEVGCFVKQLGARPVGDWGDDPPTVDLLDITVSPPRRSTKLNRFKNGVWRLRDKKGGSLDEWPAELRVRQFPGVSP